MFSSRSGAVAWVASREAFDLIDSEVADSWEAIPSATAKLSMAIISRRVRASAWALLIWPFNGPTVPASDCRTPGPTAAHFCVRIWIVLSRWPIAT